MAAQDFRTTTPAMLRRAPDSLYHDTFSPQSTPASPFANGCCGPMDASHESVVMELTTTLNKREYEIRSLVQNKTALNKILQKQVHPVSKYSTFGTLPSHSVDMRDELHHRYMREEEQRIQIDGAVQNMKDKMIESTKQEKSKTKERTITLETTINTLNDEIAMYKKQMQASEALEEEQRRIHEKNEKVVDDLKAKNTDLWKKWKKEAYTVKCKDALLDMQRQRLEEQENLIKNFEKKFPSGEIDIPKRTLLHCEIFFSRFGSLAHIHTNSHVVLARIDEGEMLWSKIGTREMKFKERKSIICILRNEIATLKSDKKELQDEMDQLKKCFASLHLKLRETGDKIDMTWLLSQLRDTASSKERNAELEEIIAGNGYTVKAAEAENDLRKKEHELATAIEETNAVMENLRVHAKDLVNIELSELINKMEMALLVLGSEEVTNKRIDATFRKNAILMDRVAELEEIIRGQGYTVKAAAAEHELRTKEIDLAGKVKTITDVLEALNDVMDGVDNTEVAALLRRIEKVLLKISYERESSLNILTQHSVISEVGWNLGCVTFEPADYAELAIGRSDSTVTTVRSLSPARSDSVWAQFDQLDAIN